MKVSRSTVAGLLLGALGVGVSLGVFFYQENAARTARCEAVLDQAQSDVDLLFAAITRSQAAKATLADAESALRAASMKRDKAEAYFNALGIEILAGRYSNILRQAKAEYLRRYGDDAFQHAEFGIITAGSAWSEVITELGYPRDSQQRQLDARVLQGHGFEWANYIPGPSASEREIDGVIAALDQLTQDQAVRRDEAFEFEFQNAGSGTAILDRLTAANNESNLTRTTAQSALSAAEERESVARNAAQRSCAAIEPQCGADRLPPACSNDVG